MRGRGEELASPSAQRFPSRATVLSAPGIKGQVSPIAVLHAINDGRCPFAVGATHPEVLTQVMGPLNGVHAHQPALSLFRPVPPMAQDVVLADLFPLGLGVDEHPVELEYHRLDRHGRQVTEPGAPDR